MRRIADCNAEIFLEYFSSHHSYAFSLLPNPEQGASTKIFENLCGEVNLAPSWFMVVVLITPKRSRLLARALILPLFLSLATITPLFCMRAAH